AYPNSNYECLRQIYFVEANSGQLIQDLNSFNQTVFPGGRISEEIIFQYSPNDYGLVSNNEQLELDLIRAKEAWSVVVAKGAPPTIIGMTDTYADPNHEDLSGVIVAGNNFPSHISRMQPSHGTSAVGAVAGNTDNGIGLSSIGFNSQVEMHSHASDLIKPHTAMLDMSTRLKVMNGSWILGKSAPECAFSYNFSNTMITSWSDLQIVYNEIYENGANAVFSAGNG